MANTSSAAISSANAMLRSVTVVPSSRNSAMTRWRVMPLRKVPLSAGVETTPSLAMNRFAVANSATWPRWSSMTALSNPLSRASLSARATLGYRHEVLASVGAMSGAGLRKRDRQVVMPSPGGSGASNTDRKNRVLSGTATTNPSSE